MPTNEERREIAKSIRKIARIGFLGITYFSSLSIESLFNLEVEGSFLGVNYYTKSSAMRMADLIEPEPERKAKSKPFPIEKDTGFFDTTKCECGYLNDVSATYCGQCGGLIEVVFE